MANQMLHAKTIAFSYKDLKNPSIIPLNACFNSPKPKQAVEAIARFAEHEASFGSALPHFHPALSNATTQGGLRGELASMLGAQASSISLHPSTKSALEVFAKHFPFHEGDKVIAFRGDYPSVYESFMGIKGVALELLEPIMAHGAAVHWNLERLAHEFDKNPPRVVAISECLYTSGAREDLRPIINLCKLHGTTLIVDVAQSIGFADLSYLHDADAIVFPGWKGLLFPRGVAALRTSSELTNILLSEMRSNETAVNEVIRTGMTDIENNDATPLQPSTLATNMLAGALVAIRDFSSQTFGLEAVRSEVQHLQLLLAEKINPSYAVPVLNPDERGGLILAVRLLKHRGKETEVVKAALEKGLIITTREGFIRFAPHFFNTESEVVRAAEIFNDLLSAD